MSSNQRLEVWRGTRAKTSGGLTKADLTKNKRGKIVSKKKSHQAGSQNNLGSWLREKGKKVPKDEMLRKKGDVDAEKASKNKPKKGGAKAVPKKKPVPKPKPAAAKPKKAAAAKPNKKPKVVRKKNQSAPKGKVNPLTQQPYEKKNPTGYVSGGNVSLDNVKRTMLRPRKRVNYAY
jgi:hypothetical protein